MKWVRYKTQQGSIPNVLFAIGMFSMLFSGVLLFVSAPSLFLLKPYLTFNSVPGIILSVLLFLFGNWLNSIFPMAKVTHKGIRCKRMFFSRLVMWSEMDTIRELKNGVMALSINRNGLPPLNGLFFEWLTGKALRQNAPMILFTPEFFGSEKAIPQEIIANTPVTNRVNEYLSSKINGTGFINPSRFSVQESDGETMITIPGRKNFLAAIIFIPMALLWSYFAAYGIYIFALANFGAILGIFQGAWDTKIFRIFVIFDAFMFFFLGFMVFWVWGVFASIARDMVGKEIIETTGQSLIITRQIFKWKRRREYSAVSISNLRINVTKPGVFNALHKGIQTLFGRDGKIVFDFEKKSVRVGLDISEDEGKYILDKIKPHLKT
jgi:hypothetical protein